MQNKHIIRNQLIIVAGAILYVTGLLKPLHASLLFTHTPHFIAPYGYWCSALCIGIAFLCYIRSIGTYSLNAIFSFLFLFYATTLPLVLYVSWSLLPALMLLFFGLVESCCFVLLSLFWSYCHGTHTTPHAYSWFGAYLIAGHIGYTLGLLTARILPIPAILIGISSIILIGLTAIAAQLPFVYPVAPDTSSWGMHHFASPVMQAITWSLLLYQGIHTWMETHIYYQLTTVTQNFAAHASYAATYTLAISLSSTVLTPLIARIISRHAPRAHLLFILPGFGLAAPLLFSHLSLKSNVVLFSLLRIAYFCWFTPYREISCTQLSDTEKYTLRPLYSIVSKYAVKGAGALSSPPALAFLCGFGVFSWYRAHAARVATPPPKFTKAGNARSFS